MTPSTLEQKIEAEAKEFASEYVDLNYSYVPSMTVATASCIDAFTAAALPLHEEIQELRQALDLVTREMVQDYIDYVKLTEIRSKFQLDEVKP